MKKGINLYFANNIHTKDKLLAIKEAGYDEFFTGFNEVGEDMTVEEQLEFAKSIGLNCTMIHCKYTCFEECIWLDDKRGDEMIQNYLDQIKRCAPLCKNFVVHLSGLEDFPLSQIGLDRIKQLVKKCEECNVNLCVENLNQADKEMSFLVKNIQSDNLRCCYDVGHLNFTKPNINMVENYNDKIVVLHIHDNDGKKDLHLVPFTATLDWKKVAKRLAYAKNDLVLSSELKCVGDDYKEVLLSNFDALKKLEKMIIKNKKSLE